MKKLNLCLFVFISMFFCVTKYDAKVVENEVFLETINHESLIMYNNIENINIDYNVLPINTLAKILNICKQSGILKSFRFLGYLLLIAKIIIPILLIIMGSIDFAKAMVASNQDAVQKAGKSFAIRIATAVIIFVLPTIINFVFGLLPNYTNDYNKCRTCIFKPNDCEIPE